MPTYLTTARTAVWDAIENWAALKSDGSCPLNRKLRFNTANDGIDDVSPAYTDLPAVVVWPGTVNPDVWVNRAHRYKIPYTVHIWTKDWLLTTAENYLVEVMAAIYKSGPDIVSNPTQTYVKNATGNHPVLNGAYNMDRIFIGDISGGQKAIRTTWTFQLQMSSDPYARA